MFVALMATDGSRVTSIAPRWDNAVEDLRSLAETGQLTCPGCRQTLWLRSGTERRRHFAHRSLTECPLEAQSAEVREAKAQLYRWLETKYPGKVNLDIGIGVAGLVKTVDLLVEPEPGRKFAYWVFDRQQRNREELLPYRSRKDVQVHFIHTQTALKLHSEREIALSTFLRDFIQCSDFDESVAIYPQGHLHLLLGEESKLCIYRGLRCVHGPNLYGWEVRREDSLAAALISPKTGELVFAADEAARKDWDRRRDRMSAPGVPARMAAAAPSIWRPNSLRESPDGQIQGNLPLDTNGPFRCLRCGTETKDWCHATPSAGTCICRNCFTGRRSQGTGDQSKEGLSKEGQ